LSPDRKSIGHLPDNVLIPLIQGRHIGQLFLTGLGAARGGALESAG